jgi:hypothetical protein
MQSLYAAFYAFCAAALGFIFRNRGPLQKVCLDADTHARPRQPPGAALGCRSASSEGWSPARSSMTQK